MMNGQRSRSGGGGTSERSNERRPLLAAANYHDNSETELQLEGAGDASVKTGTGSDNDDDVQQQPEPEEHPDAPPSRQDNGHQISNFDTLLHMLKGNIGTGILAMPDAIRNAGLLVGNVGLIFMSIICVHCMHMLVKCAHTLGQRTNSAKLKYPEVAELAFKTANWERIRPYDQWAKRVINVFLCVTQLGFCCVYFVFVAQNVQMVMDHHFGALDYHAYMAIILVPMLILCSISNLRLLSPISAFANFLQLSGLVMVFIYLFNGLPDVRERKMFASWSQLPLYFGTAIYAFEGIGVVLPLENQMRYPADLRGWNGVLNTSMTLVSCLYIAVGFFGYLKYGEDVKASITLNLPVEDVLAQFIIIMFALAIFFSYALQFYVPIEIIQPWVESKFPNRINLVNYALRYSTVLFTFALASAIPRLDLFISLVGACSSSTLALMAPPVIDIITFWPDMGQHRWRLFKNVFIFTIGFVGMLTGSILSFKNLVNYFVTGDA